MRQITYLVPTKYLNMRVRSRKPIIVRAWETPIRGLIIQRPIAGSRRGEVHLTHKASGAILVFNIKGLQPARTMARRLKRFPVNFAIADPAALYRKFAKFSDRQVRDFRKITGMKGEVDPARWRGYALHCARSFAAVARDWMAGRATPNALAARNRKGKGKHATRRN